MNKILVETGKFRFKLDVPSEIGNIISQHTKEHSHKNGWLIVILVLLLIMVRASSLDKIPWWSTIIVLVLLAIYCVYVIKTRFNVSVGIVGTQGFKYYKLKLSKRRQRITYHKLCVFKDISAIIFSKTHFYKNENYVKTYSNTLFTFKVYNEKKVVYKQTGQYVDKCKYLPINMGIKDIDKESLDGWQFIFFRDVEDEWTKFLMISLMKQLQTCGFVQFKINSSHTVEVGMDYLKYNDVVIHKEEIGNVHSEDGFLYIEHRNFESKLLGLKTKGDRIIIPVNDMYNQKAFLMFLNNIVNFSTVEK